MAREDLNPIEEARACAALVEELGLTREDVGLRVGRGRVAVSNLLRLLDLPDEALGLIEEGTLSEGHGRALLLASDHDARRRLASEAAVEGWSVRVLEQRARDANAPSTAPARRGARTPAGGVHPDQEEASRDHRRRARRGPRRRCPGHAEPRRRLPALELDGASARMIALGPPRGR